MGWDTSRVDEHGVSKWMGARKRCRWSLIVVLRIKEIGKADLRRYFVSLSSTVICYIRHAIYEIQKSNDEFIRICHLYIWFYL